jgi:hypothetical protein
MQLAAHPGPRVEQSRIRRFALLAPLNPPQWRESTHRCGRTRGSARLAVNCGLGVARLPRRQASSWFFEMHRMPTQHPELVRPCPRATMQRPTLHA